MQFTQVKQRRAGMQRNPSSVICPPTLSKVGVNPVLQYADFVIKKPIEPDNALLLPEFFHQVFSFSVCSQQLITSRSVQLFNKVRNYKMFFFFPSCEATISLTTSPFLSCCQVVDGTFYTPFLGPCQCWQSSQLVKVGKLVLCHLGHE